MFLAQRGLKPLFEPASLPYQKDLRELDLERSRDPRGELWNRKGEAENLGDLRFPVNHSFTDYQNQRDSSLQPPVLTRGTDGGYSLIFDNALVMVPCSSTGTQSPTG